LWLNGSLRSVDIVAIARTIAIAIARGELKSLLSIGTQGLSRTDQKE